MHDILESALACIASNALVATMLAAVAWVASRWSKPTVAHAVWLLVLVKLLTPPLVDLPLPVAAVLDAPTSDARAADERAANPAAEPAPGTHAEDDSAAVESFVIAAPTSRITEVCPPADADAFDDNALDTLDADLVEADVLDIDLPAHGGVLWQRAEAGASELELLAGERPLLAAQLPQSYDTGAALDTGSLGTSDETAASATSPVVPTSGSDDAEATSLGGAVLPALAVAWLGGAGAWFVFAAARLRRFRRAMRDATPATPPLQAEIEELAARIGLRRAPEVRVVAAPISPLVWTRLGRAVLVLPRELLARLSDSQRAAVIAHELAHLRRRDHWTRWLELVAVGCYWWLPTVWLARRKLHQAEEACCDAWVVWLLPQQRRDYARALLETIDFLDPASETPLLASGFARASSLKRRFDMILAQRHSHRLSWPGRMAVAAAAVLVLPWTISPLSAEDESTQPVVAAGVAPPSGGASQPIADAPPPASNANTPEDSGAAITPPAVEPRVPGVGSPPTGSPAPSVSPSRLPEPGTGALTPPMPASPGGSDSTAVAVAPPPVGPPAVLPAVPGPLSGDAEVHHRLARLEATTAELLAIVKQLRDDRQGGDPFGAGSNTSREMRDFGGSGRGFADGGREFANEGRIVDSTRPATFLMPVTVDGREVVLIVNGGQIVAYDTKVGKTVWTTKAGRFVTAVQSRGNIIEAITADGTTLILDVNTGEIKYTAASSERRPRTPASGTRVRGAASNGDATVIKDGPASGTRVRGAASGAPATADRSPAVASTADPHRIAQATAIELEMLQLERKLALERADLAHEVRLSETRRDRLLRKLDTIPRDADNAEEHAKLTAQLEESEDRLTVMQHRLEVFEADLEYKLRELQIRRDQLLRGIEPASAPQPDPSPRPSQPRQ